MPVGAFAGRFPAALALMPASLPWDDDEPCPRSCEVVGVVRLDPERFDAVTYPATRVPVSDPADDCELGLRTMTGLLLDAAVAATILLPALLVTFSPLAGKTDGGGRISVPGMLGLGAEGADFVVGDEWVSAGVEGEIACCSLDDAGSGGGGISEAPTGVRVVPSSPTVIASSYDAGGDAKRAVGRGPDAEGPLDFFKMECGGAGLDDDGVGPLELAEGADPCPGV